VNLLDAKLAALDALPSRIRAALDTVPGLRHDVEARVTRLAKGAHTPNLDERMPYSFTEWDALTPGERIAHATPRVAARMTAAARIEPAPTRKPAPTVASRYSVACGQCGEERPAPSSRPVAGFCPACMGQLKARRERQRADREAGR
jgi:hypothetical protein